MSTPSSSQRPRRAADSDSMASGTAATGVRTCAGCGRRVEDGRAQSAAGAGLVRLVFGPRDENGRELAIDSGEGTFGRGTYVHPRVDCVRSAGSKGIARRRPKEDAAIAAGQDQPPTPATPLLIAGEPLTATSLRTAIAAAYRRRLVGLVSAARRGRTRAVGTDAACAAVASGEARLVLVASDAASAAARTEIRGAIASGRAVAWGTKQELGDLVSGGRDEGVAVVAFLDPRIAAAVRDAVHVVDGLVLGQVSDQGVSSKL